LANDIKIHTADQYMLYSDLKFNSHTKHRFSKSQLITTITSVQASVTVCTL